MKKYKHYIIAGVVTVISLLCMAYPAMAQVFPTLQFTLTTTGTSGAATFANNVLNIPQYSGSGGSTLITAGTGISTTTAGSGVKVTSIGTTTATLWVDGNRTVSNQTGTIEQPFETLSGLIAGLPTGVAGYAINMAPASYVDGAPVTFPNLPTYISGNESTYVAPSGITIPNSFDIYDLSIIGNITDSDTGLSSIHQFTNGFIQGNVTAAGLTTFSAMSTANTGIINALSGSFMGFIASNINDQIEDSGVMNINTSQVTRTDSSNYAVAATSTYSELFMNGVTLMNFGTGGGIDVNNGATSTPNLISNVSIVTNGTSITAGNAATVVCNDQFNNTSGTLVAPTGTNFIPCYDESRDILNTLTLAALATPAGSFLAVNASGQVIATTAPSGSGSGTVGTGTTGQFPYYAANGTTLTATSSIFLATSGNVGIGTTSPAKPLTVEGSTAGGIARVQRDVTSPASNTAFGTTDFVLNEIGGSIQAFSGPAIQFGTELNGGAENENATISGYPISAANNGGLQISTLNNGLNYPALNVTNLQQVGVATTSPGAQLSVALNSLATYPAFLVSTSSLIATTTVFEIDQNGNVEIGTTTQFNNALVSVEDNSPFADIELGSQNVNNWIGYGGNRTMIGFNATQGTAEIDAGSGKGLRLNVNGTNGTFPTGTTGLEITSGDELLMGTTSTTNCGLTIFACVTGTSTTASALSTIFEVASSSGASLLQVLGNGNVGVGTTSPSNNFSVQGNSYLSGTTFLGGAITATSTLTLSALTGTQCLQEVSGLVSGTGSGCGPSITGTQGQDVYIGPSGTALATSTIFILPNGDTGVGTTSPSTQLQVFSTAGAGTVMSVDTTGNGSSYRLYQNGVDRAEIDYWSNLGTRSNTLEFNAGLAGATNAITFRLNSIERFRIDSTGNIGIATSTPFAMLSVAGVAGGTTSLFGISTSTATFSTSTVFYIDKNGNALEGLNGAFVGIGTTTPTAILSSVAASTTAGTVASNFAGMIFMINGFENTVLKNFFGIDQWGHPYSSGDLPTVSGSGTPTITALSNDWSGSMIVSGTAVSSITLNFAHPWKSAPNCTISETSTASIAGINGISTTAMTVSLSVGLTSDQIWYQCIGNQ